MQVGTCVVGNCKSNYFLDTYIYYDYYFNRAEMFL